jgi:hypothetical protein
MTLQENGASPIPSMKDRFKATIAGSGTVTPSDSYPTSPAGDQESVVDIEALKRKAADLAEKLAAVQKGAVEDPKQVLSRSTVMTTTIRMNNGKEIPQLALGVYKAPNDETTERAVRWALEAGYRHVDSGKYSFRTSDFPF